MPHPAHHTCPPPGIRISGAHLTFAAREVFSDLHFTAEAGQFTGILGPSGVGKTTLLKVIAGLHPQNGATVTDHDGNSLRNRIAWMAQKDLLLPWLTVVENVGLGARLRHQVKSDTHNRALELLEAVGLHAVADQHPDTLSGGMRQRAALARTLMEDRPIILMDEPFSAVDPLTRISLQDTAARMLKGRTVVFVTHDPLEALRLGHKVLVLNGQPAHLHSIDVPKTEWPRPVDSAEVLRAQGDILSALARSDVEASA